MSDHPLIYLIQVRTRGARCWREPAALSVLALGLAWLSPVGSAARLLLLAASAGIWPAWFTARAVLELGGRDSWLEVSPVSPARLVDGLALWLAARSSLPILGLALALQAPLALTLGLLVAYLGLLGWIWSDGEDDLLPRMVVAGLALTPGLVLVSWGWTGSAGLVSVLMLRGACLLGWRRAPRWAAWWRRRTRGRAHRWGRSWEDALLYREVRRSRLQAWRLLPPGLVGAGSGLALACYQGAALAFTLGILLLLVQSLRAGLATVGSLADEREGRTLEALLGTALQPQELISSWVRWGIVPITLETILLGGALAALVPAPQWLATLLVILAGSLGAAYAGLAASAGAARRVRAQDTLGLWLVAGIWLPGLVLVLAAGLGWPWLSPLAWGLPWWWRRRAWRSLNLAPDVPERLEALRVKAPADFKASLLARLEQEGLVR